MNPLKRIETAVRKQWPSAALKLDLPSRPSGSSFLDIASGDFHAVVEWRPDRGIGLSVPPGHAYGAGPDEVFTDAAEVIARLKALVKAKRGTVPEREISLKRLREIRRMTQEELARRLDVKQATVSKLERRAEIYVSSVRRVVAALGGELQLVAHFPDGTVTLDLGE